MFTFIFNLLVRILINLFNMSGIFQKVENILHHGQHEAPPPRRLPIEWNHGVLKAELLAHSIFAGEHDHNKLKEDSGKAKFATGTYIGTKKAVSDVYTLVNKSFASFFDVHQLESHLPTTPISLEEKKERFQFQTPGSDGYPPHLSLEPKVDFLHSLKIFQPERLFATAPIVQKVIPEKFLDFAYDEPNQRTFALIESVNQKLFDERRDIGKVANIGTRKDWYSDEVYAQQQFTGVNPVTIRKAEKEWIQRFKAAASAQEKRDSLRVIEEAERQGGLYVQDCSYFRKFAGVAQGEDLKSDDGKRFGCASVSLFHLLPNGTLHPLAIILDYRTNITDSLTLFNNRTSPTSPKTHEATDWPWRYAKQCAQVSDWHAHELGSHLTHTHLIEEGIIISSHRHLPESHPVFRLLAPHWLKTLPLNAAARASLIPQVIVNIDGLPSKGSLQMVCTQYETFDFVGSYIPHDLASRGFPLAELDAPKFHNYAYARNMKHIWYILRRFVSGMLRPSYPSDSAVSSDTHLQDWCREIQSEKGADIASFPTITTFDQLTDAVTMCIHIASTQHTAVNYLQDYYQAFIPNKPSALFAPLPSSLQELKSYTEESLINSLPVREPRSWLLASHLPYLLSSVVADDQSLLEYALSVRGVAGESDGVGETEEVAGRFYEELVALEGTVNEIALGVDDRTVLYRVLAPERTAVSILI
ncbi:putative lipoxygenase protein [Botrytis fragariae]|uniref:Manganese lipoxygenase n=1 Tax=Botrytis fragariae TaxID=1964551 RepID=A0A8H6EFT6_9HELO|nr:putative lipoxygenase protein [Botrytis fragariae]KAF5870677.1 putative lipoxygenase protein [Botrytis fragariae]